MTKCRDCNTTAKYGVFKTKRPIFCSSHANKKIHENVVCKRCLKCKRQPIYGVKGQKPIFCSKHCDKSIHINVVTKRCHSEGCLMIPSFGVKEGKAIFCSQHKEETHIRLYSKPCKLCNKQALFGNKTPEFCLNHKDKSHKNLVSIKCKIKNCMILASFGKLGKSPKYCFEHKLEDDILLSGKRCKSKVCSQYEYKDRAYAYKFDPETGKKDLCINCWRTMYPSLDDKIKVRKEHFILSEIQRQIPELEKYFLVGDCRIPNQSCITSRPDMAWIVKDTLIHVEIDEAGDSHEDNDLRIIGIHSATDAKNHICIRFNPDKSSDGHQPCLKKTHLCNGEKVFEKNEQEWNRRMEILIPCIRNILKKSLKNENVVTGEIKLCF